MLGVGTAAPAPFVLGGKSTFRRIGAGGPKADYVVADKKIIMTGDDREKPWMSASGGRLKGKRIIVYVDSERMEVDGGTQVDFSNGINFPAN